MKNKTPKCEKVQYFTTTSKTTKIVKAKKNNIISMMTFCQACKKQITRKNVVNGFHLCDNCNDLTPPEIYIKVTEGIDKETHKYVNWDADLDYLYYHFWLDM